MLKRYAILLFASLFLSMCTSSKPEKIYFGKDVCDHCKMVISDKRFGAEIVSEKGKIYKFDSIECMHKFGHEHVSSLGSSSNQYFVNSLEEGEMVHSDQAFIYENPSIRSPMGKGYFVSNSEDKINKAIGSEKKIEIIRWKDLLPKLDNELK